MAKQQQPEGQKKPAQAQQAPQQAPQQGGQPQTQQSQDGLKVFADPKINYSYHDFFAVYSSPEEVIIEFGNRNRARPNEAVISHRAVLSVSNAVRLRNALSQGIQRLQQAVEEARKNAGQQGGEQQAGT